MSDKEDKNDEKGKSVLTQLSSLETERSSWAGEVADAMELVIPNRSNMEVSTSTPTYTKSTTRKDGTAASSLKLFANGLLGNVCPQRLTWFKTQMENYKAQKASGVAEYMDDITSFFYHMFNGSSFYTGAWQVFMDGGGSGLGTMYMGEDLKNQKIDFLAYEPKGIYIATDEKGKIDTNFQRFIYTARDIVKKYGEDKLTKTFIDNYKKRPYTRHEVVQGVFPREDRDIFKMDAINMEFASLHVLKTGSKLLRESGYNSFPYAHWRYEYGSGEVYPWSPTLTGFPDIERLNTINGDTTRLSHLAAYPPVMVPAEMYGDFRIEPRFKVPGYDMSRKPEPLLFGQGYGVAKDQVEMYQQIVKEHYFTNFFLMLSAAAGTNMTATQVLEMQGEKATVIGGMVARLTQEFFDPLFDRIFMIAAKNGWIPEPPEALLALGGDISIDYMGPLSMAQKRMLELSGPMNAIENFLPVAQAYPEMRHLIKPYETGKQILIGGGMPHANIREERDYNQLVEAEQKQLQEAAQTEQIEKEAGALQKGSKKPEEGSPSELVMAGMQNG